MVSIWVQESANVWTYSRHVLCFLINASSIGKISWKNIGWTDNQYRSGRMYNIYCLHFHPKGLWCICRYNIAHICWLVCGTVSSGKHSSDQPFGRHRSKYCTTRQALEPMTPSSLERIDFMTKLNHFFFRCLCVASFSIARTNEMRDPRPSKVLSKQPLKLVPKSMDGICFRPCHSIPWIWN